MPEFLFLLDAPDDFLKNRIMHLPETVVAGTHNTEDGLIRRLTLYRSLNTDDETVINFFDEREVSNVHSGRIMFLNLSSTKALSFLIDLCFTSNDGLHSFLLDSP